MRTQGRIRPFNSIQRRIESKSRGEAERQARKVSWLTLLECRRRYIEWEAFTLWAHAVEEAEHQAPAWLALVVAGRCPGIESQKGEKLWKCLDTWKHETLFAKPNREGWMRGVSFFAVRELAYAQYWAYWAYCEEQWSVQRPASYPSCLLYTSHGAWHMPRCVPSFARRRLRGPARSHCQTYPVAKHGLVDWTRYPWA